MSGKIDIQDLINNLKELNNVTDKLTRNIQKKNDIMQNGIKEYQKYQNYKLSK